MKLLLTSLVYLQIIHLDLSKEWQSSGQEKELALAIVQALQLVKTSFLHHRRILCWGRHHLSRDLQSHPDRLYFQYLLRLCHLVCLLNSSSLWQVAQLRGWWFSRWVSPRCQVRRLLCQSSSALINHCFWPSLGCYHHLPLGCPDLQVHPRSMPFHS